jgi:transposase
MSGPIPNPTHVLVASTRRSWTCEQKRAILAEAKDPATTVSAVARRHGLSPSLLFRWRREIVDAERAAANPVPPAFVPLCLPKPVDTSRRERTPHGVKDATTDRNQIKAWWGESPDANIGLAPGREWDILVLDIDPRHGGEKTLRQLKRKFGALPETVTANTGGGGQHLFFKHPNFNVIGSPNGGSGTFCPALS